MPSLISQLLDWIRALSAQLRQQWREFRQSPAGHRFRNRYHRRTESQSSRSSVFGRLLGILTALLCLFIALPLIILPGPAIFFFGLAGYLLAGESRFIAALCDYLELRGRSWIKRWHRRRQRRLVEPA